MSELRRIPLARALYRPALILECERELLIAAFAGTVGLAAVSMNVVAMIYAVVALPASIFLLRKMAKADPEMSKVYSRQMKYAGYYPPRSTHWRD